MADINLSAQLAQTTGDLGFPQIRAAAAIPLMPMPPMPTK